MALQKQEALTGKNVAQKANGVKLAIKNPIILLYAIILGLLLAIIILVNFLTDVEERVAAAQLKQSQSNHLAHQLHQSSDDLTRMARSYVVSGDPIFEQYFFEILGIRDGTMPRPQDYDNIYWDFVISDGERPTPFGEPVSLLDMINQVGVSDDELAKLEEAKQNSDDLTYVERVAFAAMKGLFEDDLGAFTIRGEPDPEFARKILYDDNYHAAKANIMRPINEFIKLVDERTRQELEIVQEQEVFYRNIAIFLTIMMFLFFFCAFFLVNRSEIFKRTIMNTMVDGLVVLSQDGIIIETNHACLNIFGYEKEDIVGKNISALMPKPDRDKHDGYIKKFLKTGKGKILGIGPREVTGLHKNGKHIDLEIAIETVAKKGQQVFVGSLRDISLRKKVEEKLKKAQKMEAIGNLTGGVAHDFNNLLTAIIGSLQLLKSTDKKLSEDAHECIDIAINSSMKGADLVQRMLAFSRKQTLKLNSFDINGLVRDIVPMFRRTISESITIETRLTPGQALVRMDESELENALLNLTINAQDAMPEGGHLIFEVEEKRFTKPSAVQIGIPPGKYVVLSVTDNGHGMPPEVRDQVFDPFFTTKSVDKGTGLGLSTVYGFMKQSGGHIAVYSEVGKGTTFRLFMKATKADQIVKPKVSKAPAKMRKGAGTILLVEDEREVRKFISQALSSKGYKVLDVGDGPSAILVMDSHPEIDLLLTDMVLPKGMSGADIGKVFEKLFPGKGIIYSSGYTGKAIKKSGWLQGGEKLLSKPYDLEVLLDWVHTAINEKS